MEKQPCDKPGEITTARFEKYDFAPILKQNSILSRLRDYGLGPLRDPVGPAF